jgi:hypothetical protein
MATEDITFTQNQKGNENLVDSGGFAYRKNKILPVKDRIYWTCVMKTRFHCPATAVTTITSKQFVSKMGDHTHSNQLLERTVKNIQKNHVRIAAASATAVPRIILGDITAEIENTVSGASAFIAPKHAVSKAIQRQRNLLKGFPMKPKGFDDLITIPAKLTVTSDDKPFLIFNDLVYSGDPSPNPKRILIFMSEHSRLNLVTLFILILQLLTFYVLSFDILSHSTFCHSTFCPILRFVIRPFVPFYVLSFDILSHSTFCHSTFCPILRFVIRPFVPFYVLSFDILSHLTLSEQCD